MIATADSLDGQYRDHAAMIEAMIGRVTIEARGRGWKGLKLLAFDWRADLEFARDGELVKHPPIALIVAGPGHGQITVAECRAILKDKIAAQRATPAEGRKGDRPSEPMRGPSAASGEAATSEGQFNEGRLL